MDGKASIVAIQLTPTPKEMPNFEFGNRGVPLGLGWVVDFSQTQLKLFFCYFAFGFWGFWTPGLVPLDAGRDSVQIPAIFTSVAAIWTLFVLETIFEESSNKQF